ncbi:MAG: GNAT family N-acetyltransferase [Blastocatellia bacterium]
MLKVEEASLSSRGQYSPRLADGMRIVAGDEIPAAALDRFYERMLPSRANFLERHRRWLYPTGDGVSARTPIAVMAEDRVVGHISIIPVTMRRGREARAVALACDIAVIPECRGKALGRSLFDAVRASCPLRIGFPNEMSGKVLNKLNWDSQRHILGLSLILRPERHPKVREISTGARGAHALAATAGFATRAISRACTWSRKSLSAGTATAERLAVFSEEAPAALHIARSTEFLRWRILDHPCAEEHVVLSLPNGGGERCSAIARVVDDNGCRRLHLLTLRNRSGRSGLSDFFAGVIRWALDEDIHVISLVTSDPSVAAVAGRWLPISKRVAYAYDSDDPAGKEFLGGTDHIWEYIDGDFDLVYVSHRSPA